MAPIKRSLAVLLPYCLATIACSQINSTGRRPPAVVFVGSTPGDSFVKSLLTIPADTKVDFIRWELTLNKGATDSNTFILNVVSGEGQPNTSGFKGGGEKRSFAGKYTVAERKNGTLNAEIYQLKTDKSLPAISLIKLNDNLFHLLTPAGKLMVGNGGWSYTLNRKEPLANISSRLPSLTAFPSLLNDTARQVIFDGRTPCAAFAKQYDLKVGDDCMKLKWKFILHRDSTGFLPTTYTLDWTLSRSRLITGKWKIVKGAGSNPHAVIYQLDPDKPNASISFLVGDENVLFFLDKKNTLFVGDSNFSYTLNRRP